MITGKVPNAQQNFKFYGLNNSLTSISGTQGNVSYQGLSAGRLHVNTEYYIIYISENYVEIYDDTGVSVVLPIAYQNGLPLTLELGFGTNANRLFGYSAYIEMAKKQIVDLDFDRCVKENQSGEVFAPLKSLISFTHTTPSGSTATYYPTSPNHIITPSGISNNLCYASIIDWQTDNGYRSETKIVSANSNLTNKNGGLQRFKFSADVRLNSEDNPSGEYNTYIFQLHDAGFSLAGWVDAPPLAIRLRGTKLYAMVNYIDDGAVPESDNRHTTDEYELCDFSFDAWHHIDIQARIGWKNSLLPQLVIIVDGVERLNLDTPIGFNIVSSGGYVLIQFGVYCPQLTSGAYADAHREVLYTNVKCGSDIQTFV